MKDRNVLAKLGDFVLGKGFYIVLFLCVATIGISGYYLIRSVDIPDAEPVGAGSSVILPDSEAEGPDPVGLPLPGEDPDVSAGQPVSANQPVEVPDEPQPEQKPRAQEPVRKAPAVYTWPVKGEVLRDFSVETLSPDPTLGDWRTHGGLDIAASLGTKVLAMSDGTVTEVRQDGLMGTTVVIDHGDGLLSTYCNLAAQPTVSAGDTVTTGAVIGTVGDTAIAEVGLVSHLHLEVSLEGEAVDPTEYLPELA